MALVPISLEGVQRHEAYGANEFQERFLEGRAEHRDSGRALAFAFLLYDLRHPEVLKLLRGSDYWPALDSLSGEYQVVFSLQSAASHGEYATLPRALSLVAFDGNACRGRLHNRRNAACELLHAFGVAQVVSYAGTRGAQHAMFVHPGSAPPNGFGVGSETVAGASLPLGMLHLRATTLKQLAQATTRDLDSGAFSPVGGIS